MVCVCVYLTVQPPLLSLQLESRQELFFLDCSILLEFSWRLFFINILFFICVLLSAWQGCRWPPSGETVYVGYEFIFPRERVNS